MKLLLSAIVFVGVVGNAFGATDVRCLGVSTSGPNQFCCGGVVYYDPNGIYGCCNGNVCVADQAWNVVPQPVVQQQQQSQLIIQPLPVQPRTTTTTPAPVQIVDPSFGFPFGFPFNVFPQQPNYWQPQIVVAQTTTTTTTTQGPQLFCDGVNLTNLQKVQPSLACCGNSVVYDSRYYSCSSSQVQAAPVQVQPQQQVNLPTSYTPIVCQQSLYYIDPTISNYYKCCSSMAYDSRAESCQQAYRMTYQPTNTFRVSPIDPSNPPQRSVLNCGDTKYIFSRTDGANQYTC